VAFLVTSAVRHELDQLGYQEEEVLPVGVGRVGWFTEEAAALAWLDL
jgi:hypothetical protein